MRKTHPFEIAYAAAKAGKRIRPEYSSRWAYIDKHTCRLVTVVDYLLKPRTQVHASPLYISEADITVNKWEIEDETADS